MDRFGFSVGDIIAGIYLIHDVVQSLSSAVDSAAQYQTLMRELDCLERVLLEIEALCPRICECSQLALLTMITAQCRQTIDRFCLKIKKYQPSLAVGGSGSIYTDLARKLQWSLFSKDNIEDFCKEIAEFVQLINAILVVLQLSLNQAHADAMQKDQRNLLHLVNDIFGKFTIRLGDIFSLVQTCAAQGSTLMRSSAMIIRTNLQVYEKVLDIHKFVTSMPPQLRQDQPVYFVDAYGKETAFYLDFVFSSTVLIDWLMRRFETTGQSKIARGEFVLSDSRTNRELNLCEPWNVLFHPGMHVNMDMVFQDVCASAEANSCPACRSINDEHNGGRITCFKCNLQFHRTSSGSLSQPCAIQEWLSANKATYINVPGFIQENNNHCRIDHFRRLKLILVSESLEINVSGAESPVIAALSPPQQRPKQPLFSAESIGQVVALGFKRVEATRYLAALGNRRECRDRSAQIHLFEFVIDPSNFLTRFGTTHGKYDVAGSPYDWDCD